MAVFKNRRGTVQNTFAVGLVGLVVVGSCFMIVDRGMRSGDKDSRASGVASEKMLLRIDRERAKPAELPPAAIKNVSFPVRQSSRRIQTSHLQSIKTFHQLPRSEAEFAKAFERAASSSCVLVPEGYPLELSSFTPFAAGGHKLLKGQELPPPSIRRHAVSIGLAVSPGDRHALPALTGHLIVSYIQEHFVSIQARIVKDPLTLGLFLAPEPMAATAKFQGALITERIQPAVRSSIQNFRSLGLLIEHGREPRPESLRTLVLVHKYLLAKPGSRTSSRPRPQYELVIIRGREKDGHLELHSFVTSNSRRVLHYLGESRKPRRTTDCNIQATIYFSEYSHASLVPVKGIVRKSLVKSQSHFSLDKLKVFVKHRHWEGDVWDNVTEVLDNIIDGKITS